jgi:molybdopterin biosynthesis enzyme
MALIEVGTKRSEEFVALHNAAIRAVAEKLLADQVMLPREVRSLLDGFANRK